MSGNLGGDMTGMVGVAMEGMVAMSALNVMRDAMDPKKKRKASNPKDEGKDELYNPFGR